MKQPTRFLPAYPRMSLGLLPHHGSPHALPVITSLHNILNPQPSISCSTYISPTQKGSLIADDRGNLLEPCLVQRECLAGQAESCEMSEGFPGQRTHRWRWNQCLRRSGL